MRLANPVTYFTNPVATKRQVQARAQQLGATASFVSNANEHEVTVEAPEGYVFRSSGVHELVANDADGGSVSALYQDVLERMRDGIEACRDPECDTCGYRANPVGDPLPPQVIRAFVALGDEQRGVPEQAMLRVHRAMGGGGPLWMPVENVGDLTHRMTHMLSWSRYPCDWDGYPYVLDKVASTLRDLRHKYGFERDYRENLKANADYAGVPLELHTQRVREALREYAHAHSRLPVYNRAQWLARQAAVNLGLERFDVAERYLAGLERMLKTPESWCAAATEYRLAPNGQPMLYEP